jgi:hypothetical protein
VEGQKFQPVIPLDLEDVAPPSRQAHRAICMKTFQFTKSIFSGKRQQGKDGHVMNAESPQNKTADAKTRLVTQSSAQPGDPSHEGTLLNNTSSLLKQHQESSAHNSDLCTPNLLGSKSPTVEISLRSNSNAILKEPKMSGQAELDRNGVTEMVELD